MADLSLYINYMIKKTDEQEQQIQANAEKQKKLEAKHQKELDEIMKTKRNLEKQIRNKAEGICLTFEMNTKV